MAKVLINSAAIRKKDLVVVDGDLNVVEYAKITVIDIRTGTYALIYNPSNENELISNPFVSDSTGQFAFYADTGVYKIGVETQTDVEELEGSVIISVTSEERYHIRPEDFGAKGGSNDDTQAFTLAINEQRSTGLPIYLERPLYTADIVAQPGDDLTIYSNSKITTVKTLNKTSLTDLKSITISNVGFDFIDNPAGVNGIEITRALSVDIDGMRTKNGRRTNLVLFDCSNFLIQNSRFDDSGKDEYVNPASNVKIGSGLILQDCKSNGNDPALIKDCISSRCWQIGFFVVNKGVGTESHGNVIDGCLVFGAKDNGIRTQTQGLPFDPFRCRDHVVKNCYVSGSAIDNYRCNGANNTFVNNISFNATGYGLKSDGGTNNIINSNHDNGSSVAVGLRVGANTINYSVSGNTSINCDGSASAIYAVIAESGITAKGLNFSNNTVMEPANVNCSPYGFVGVPGTTSVRYEGLMVSGNYSSASSKQAIDISQANRPCIMANAFRDNCKVSQVPVMNNRLVFNSFNANNFFEGRDDGTTPFAVQYESGANSNRFTGNYIANFNYNPAVNDLASANLFIGNYSDFNASLKNYTVANTSTLSSRLGRSIDVETVKNRATGQESALDVLGVLVQWMADNQDTQLGTLTNYKNI